MRGQVWSTMGLASLLAVAAPAVVTAQQAPQDAPPEQRTIRVAATGEVEVEPDEATLRFAVETFAPTAREAGAQNAERMDRVIAALVEAGVERSAIETQNYSVFPEYAHGPEVREPRITGYRAVNQVVLTTQALDRVGTYIDTALEAGANRFEGVSFGITDPSAAQSEALRVAVERARGTAATIADALGVPLGPVLDASTTTQILPPPIPMFARADVAEMAPAAPPTPIEPGAQTVTAQISVIYGIGGER